MNYGRAIKIVRTAGSHPFLREALAPESESFFEFDHRDLAKHRYLLVWDTAQHRRPLSRGQARGDFSALKSPSPWKDRSFGVQAI